MLLDDAPDHVCSDVVGEREAAREACLDQLPVKLDRFALLTVAERNDGDDQPLALRRPAVEPEDFGAARNEERELGRRPAALEPVLLFEPIEAAEQHRRRALAQILGEGRIEGELAAHAEPLELTARFERPVLGNDVGRKQPHAIEQLADDACRAAARSKAAAVVMQVRQRADDIDGSKIDGAEARPQPAQDRDQIFFGAAQRWLRIAVGDDEERSPMILPVCARLQHFGGRAAVLAIGDDDRPRAQSAKMLSIIFAVGHDDIRRRCKPPLNLADEIFERRAQWMALQTRLHPCRLYIARVIEDRQVGPDPLYDIERRRHDAAIEDDRIATRQ